ncbi:MAG: CHAT domain-containing protein [Williamsia sp.]|nr:CHAT domain-containing protein [Williamsia sp.]
MRPILFILVAFFVYASAHAQCGAVSWSSVIAIRDAQQLTPAEKLARMHDCLNKIKAPCGNDSVHAMLLRQIGYLNFDLADYIRASQYFLASIQIIHANTGKPSINPRHLINSYFQLSVIYDSLNNVTEKIRAADSCIAICQRLGATSKSEYIRSLETRTEYDYDIGDYNRCVQNAEMCELLARKYAADNAANEQNALLGRNMALTTLGWLVESLLRLKDFKMAEEYLSGHIKEYEKSGPGYLGFVFTQLAQLEIDKENYGKALSLLKKAFDIEKQGGYAFTCKQILNTIGHDIYYAQYKNSEKALSYYNQALRYPTGGEQANNREDSSENAEILTYIGDVYARQGRYALAFTHFQQAFDLITPGMTEKAVLQLPATQIARYKKLHILAGLIIDKADAYLEKYKTGKDPHDACEAINIYKAADKLLVLMRATHTDLHSKLFWRKNSRRLYERAIEACYLLGNTDQAFYFFEKSRAVLLNEQLTLRNIMSDEDITSQVQLSKKMLSLERELNKTESLSIKSLAIKSQLFKDQQTMDILAQRVKEKNPLYYQSVLDTSVITLHDVYHTILKDHQAILEIFSGDSAIYSLLMVPGKAVLHKIDKGLFENLADQYIRFIASPDLLNVNSNLAAFKQISYRLYELIFQNSPVPDGRIIISPDGKNFPFESLMAKDKAGHLVDFYIDHAVSYTFSAKYLLNNFAAKASRAKGDFMGFAPVNFGERLVSLPGSEESLKVIDDYFHHAGNLTGARASRSNFTGQFARYSIIQVYTHAAASSDIKEPVIYFADSALYLSDLIPENRPATKLIVLSACETGKGQLYLGEGIFNFNRGFAAYGIPSSITNLWSVESGSTYRLTELFYKYLSQDLPIDIALQRAKKEFIQTGSRRDKLPYHWAAAILMGRTEAIPFNRQQSPAPYFIVAGISCLLIGVAAGRKAKGVK